MSADRTGRQSGGLPSDETTDWRDASSYAYARRLTRAEWTEEFVRRSRGDIPPRQMCVLSARKLRLVLLLRRHFQAGFRRLVVVLGQRLCRRVARGNS
jgi:hypothetical protein